MPRLSFIVVGLIAAAVTLLGGLAVDAAFGYGEFGRHLMAVPLVLAAYSPWMAIFFALAGVWAWIVDRLMRDQNEDQTKGLAREIVEDNNAAAAILLTMPVAILALVLQTIATMTR